MSLRCYKNFVLFLSLIVCAVSFNLEAAADEHLYLAQINNSELNTFDSKIRKVDLGTQEVSDLFIIDSLAFSLKVDADNGKVYWKNVDGQSNVSVRRANLDGTNQEVLRSGVYIGDIQLDLRLRKIFWTERVGQTISVVCADLDGSNSQTIFSRLGGSAHPLAVDSKQGLVYLAENLNYGRNVNIIRSDYFGNQQTVVFSRNYYYSNNGIDAMLVNEDTGNLIVELSTFESTSSTPTNIYEIDPSVSEPNIVSTIFSFPHSSGSSSSNSVYEHPIVFDYSRQKLLSLNRNSHNSPADHLKLRMSNPDGSNIEYVYDETSQAFSSAQYPNTLLSFDVSRTLKSLPQLAYELDQDLELTFTGNFYLNWGGANEKWILSHGSTWHFITPDGKFYRWNNGSPGANFISSSTLIATLDGSYYSAPENLYEAPYFGTLEELAESLDQSLQLYFNGSYSENWGGLGEKWIYSHAQKWYYITPDGAFYVWFGGSINNADKIANFDTSYFADPTKLHDAAN